MVTFLLNEGCLMEWCLEKEVVGRRESKEGVKLKKHGNEGRVERRRMEDEKREGERREGEGM